MKAITAIKGLIKESIIDKYNKQIEILFEEAQNSKITDHATCKKAIDLYIQAKKIESLIETTRKLLRNPYLEIVNFTDSVAQNELKPLATIQSHLQSQIDDFCLENDENVTSTLGTAKIKNKTTWMIHNHTQLPTEIIDARYEQIKKAIAPKIHDMVKAGVTIIPGIMMSKDETVQITTNKKTIEG